MKIIIEALKEYYKEEIGIDLLSEDVIDNLRIKDSSINLDISGNS